MKPDRYQIETMVSHKRETEDRSLQEEVIVALADERDELRRQRDEACAARADVIARVYRVCGLATLLDTGIVEWREVKP